MLLVRDIEVGDHTQIRQFLMQSVALYPNIGHWFDSKVLPGLAVGERRGLVLDDDGAVAGLVILKLGRRAKLCSIRIRENLRGDRWGTVLLGQASQGLLEVGTDAVYVTISEALSQEDIGFFERLGFQRVARLVSKYVNGVDELVYTCPVSVIKDSVSALGHQVLPPRPHVAPHDVERGVSAASQRVVPDLVMSIKPRFADLILQGLKLVEFRRSFSRKYEGATALFYVSKPVGSFMFTAKIAGAERASKGELWSSYGDQGGIGRDTFERYFDGRQGGYAVRLSDIRVLDPPIGLVEARELFPQLGPPQSFKTIRSEPALAEFLSFRMSA